MLAKIEFLMHRVELKVIGASRQFLRFSYVPNAPCGVESADRVRESNNNLSSFLMHHVELKAWS